MLRSCWNFRRGRNTLPELETGEIKESSKANLPMELAVRLAMLAAFVAMEVTPSTQTVIHPEDLWKHRFPLKPATVPFSWLIVCIATVAYVVFSFLGIKTRSTQQKVKEKTVAILGLTLSVLLTTVITNLIKSAVGRPRPNFLVRCYGVANYLQVTDVTKPCTILDEVEDRRKSFPSGHSSAAFSGFVYLSLYIAGKLGTFNCRGQGSSWRLVVSIIPVFAATWVGITRYVDYHHHVEDIIAGSILGTVIAYLSYKRYFKPLSSEESHQPLAWKTWRKDATTQTGHYDGSTIPQETVSSKAGWSPRLAVPSVGNKRYKALSYTGGNVNLDIRISRNKPYLGSPINGNQMMEPASYISFNWDDDEEDLIVNQQFEEMRGELIESIENLRQFVEEQDRTRSLIY